MSPNADFLVRRLRLRHLELLVALGSFGTMRAAAGQLNLSQPAISKMLAEAEDAVGARLFERTRQGMRITAAGATVLHRARIALGELAHAQDEVRALRAGANAILRVGTLSVTASLPAAVTRLRERMPGAAVHIHEGRVRELVEMLLQGDLDCVFGALTPELLNSDQLRSVQSEALFPDQLCVLASSANRHMTQRRWRWVDLRAAPWVAPPRTTLVRQAFITAYLDQGVDPPEPAIETMSSVTIGALMRLDPSLLCVVRMEHARDEVAHGLQQLVVTPSIPLPPLGLFTRRSPVEQPAVLQAFAQTLRQVAGPPAKRAKGRVAASS